MLTVWLDYQRATLLWKCELIDGTALARRGVAPSALSLLGLVRHMAYVEWHWFDHVFAGNPSDPPISVTEDPDADFNDLDPSGRWRTSTCSHRQCDVSRSIVGAADALMPAQRGRRPISCGGS